MKESLTSRFKKKECLYGGELCDVIQYGIKKHGDQKRKYNKNMPYFDHCLRVFLILKTVTEDRDTLIAGLLHDVLEDTNATFCEISDLFGEKVANIVKEVTNDQMFGFKIKSKEAIMVKLADMLDNISDCPDESYINKKIKFVYGG